MSRALIMAGHGSESSQGRVAFARLVNAVRREAHDLDVRDAYVDIETRSVAEVLAETAGPRSVVPLMLYKDAVLESSVFSVARADPLVTVTPTLGPDWGLAEVGVQRLIEAGARSDDSILLATDTVQSPEALTDIGKAARMVSAVWGGRVHVGLLGGPGTPLGDAIDIARAHGHRADGLKRGRVVISAYLMTAGDAHSRLCEAGADMVTDPLLNAHAPDPRLVSLVVARARTRPASRDFAGPDDAYWLGAGS